jgi:hypothetical protein
VIFQREEKSSWQLRPEFDQRYAKFQRVEVMGDWQLRPESDQGYVKCQREDMGD